MKRVIAFVAIIVLLLPLSGLFSACNNLDRTEAEHIERITEKLQNKYFKKDGSPKVNFHGHEVTDSTLESTIVRGFEVEILKAYDGKPEYFLVTFQPAEIGAVPGIITDTGYRTFGLNRVVGNPFEMLGVEKEDRYYVWQGTRDGFAIMKEGKLVKLRCNMESVFEDDELDQAEIDRLLKNVRSKEGRRYIRNYSYKI